MPRKVTDQSLTAHEHQRAEADTLFSCIGEGIIATDLHGRITRANPAALAILGYEASELLEGWFPALVVATYDNGSPIDIMDRPVTKAILTGKTVNARTSYRRKDGSLVPVSLNVSPIILDDKPIGAIEIFRDITLDIKSDKMKTDFISVASHQLRTPLSAINVYTRMLDDGMAGALNPEQSAFVKSVLSSVDRMNHLINTLLNITRIEAGGVNVRIATADIGALANEIYDEAVPEAREKYLQISNRIRSDIPDLDTDPILVKEVFANLLSNAIKYTAPNGSIAVRLRQSGNNVIFSVKDSGYGIPLSAQEHIFTKFFRAENILSEDVSGTGLGLYLTKTIAESLNGELWFKSIEGVGSTFYFSLPLQGSIARHGKFKLDS